MIIPYNPINAAFGNLHTQACPSRQIGKSTRTVRDEPGGPLSGRRLSDARR